MRDNSFELKVSSEIVNLKSVIKEIMNFIERNFQDISAEDLFDLKLIFSELICNAIIHGNKLDKDKWVLIQINTEDSMIRARIIDEGSGFDYKKRNALAEMNEIDIENDTEHGRGIQLVISLSNDFHYIGLGNAVEFAKKVSSNG